MSFVTATRCCGRLFLILLNADVLDLHLVHFFTGIGQTLIFVVNIYVIADTTNISECMQKEI